MCAWRTNTHKDIYSFSPCLYYSWCWCKGMRNSGKEREREEESGGVSACETVRESLREREFARLMDSGHFLSEHRINVGPSSLLKRLSARNKIDTGLFFSVYERILRLAPLPEKNTLNWKLSAVCYLESFIRTRSNNAWTLPFDTLCYCFWCQNEAFIRVAECSSQVLATS